ncbi:hypothetical protein TSUD_354590 [Trifolium subterraneum]|uniref:Glyoxalase At5g48480-like N-terminal domain-containing protein n=1 Tax=Trifolium subterraneum TaxID=3900 RepID=A0A2Z6N5M5_TRISU|nr:hypothetical protein TSUD_354590 [Trifolium subterraneum]
MDNQVLMFKRGLLVEPSKINEAVAFYKHVFTAEEVPPPPFAAAELKIYDFHYLIMPLPSHMSINDEGDNRTIAIHEFQNNAAGVQRAISAGAVLEQVEGNIAAMYPGIPMAKIRDPFGFSWYIGKSTAVPRTSLP